jgi:hypothetical protein
MKAAWKKDDLPNLLEFLKKLNRALPCLPCALRLAYNEPPTPFKIVQGSDLDPSLDVRSILISTGLGVSFNESQKNQPI